jgi:hypothetical protein
LPPKAATGTAKNSGVNRDAAAHQTTLIQDGSGGRATWPKGFPHVADMHNSRC